MSTSPPCSFFDADASAASTAWNTISRSTLFSREIASTSINSSRFIGFDLRPPRRCARASCAARGRGANRRPLKSITGTSRASRTSSREKSSTFASSASARFGAAAAARACAERLAACFLAAACGVGASTRRQPSPCQQLAAEALAALERQLQRQLDLLAGEAARSRRRFFSGRSSPGDDTSRRS